MYYHRVRACLPLAQYAICQAGYLLNLLSLLPFCGGAGPGRLAVAGHAVLLQL